MLQRFAKTSLTVIALTLAPSAAFAANVSSDDGSGTQSLTAKGANSFRAAGTLRSTRGAPVYYSGKLVYDGNTDDTCGRYTENTRSTEAVSRGGTCQGEVRVGSAADGVQYRVCRAINNFPDDCGSFTPTTRY